MEAQTHRARIVTRLAAVSVCLMAIGVAACGGSPSMPSCPGGACGPAGWRSSAKGLWIWYLSRAGLSAADAAAKAQADGVGYILLKSGQDASFWSTRYNDAVLSEFRSRGLAVLAWAYITPKDIPGSIDAVVQAAQVPGTSGVVLDVEIEFEGKTAADHAGAAQQLCEGIRAKAPSLWLAYTSFGWVGYHPGFPFQTFDTYCGDAFFPQIYWSDRGVGWSSGFTEAADMIRAAGLKAPVWPIQSNDNSPGGVAPLTADLNAFFHQAGALATLWELPSASEPAKLDQLAQLDWKN